MDGSAVVAAYRQLPGPAVPIVVLSGVPNGQRQAAALGVAGSLRQPFDLDALLARIASMDRQVVIHPATWTGIAPPVSSRGIRYSSPERVG